MKVRWSKAVLILVVVAPKCALAGFVDGNKLLEFCHDSALYCAAYVAGVVDSDEISVALTGTGDVLPVPSEVTNFQLADVVRKYLEANPERRHLRAAVLVRWAIVDAWGGTLSPSAIEPPRKDAQSGFERCGTLNSAWQAIEHGVRSVHGRGIELRLR